MEESEKEELVAVMLETIGHATFIHIPENDRDGFAPPPTLIC